MKYKHYLLTRYNLGLYDRTQKMRSGKEIDVAAWMTNRGIIWEEICCPSVSAQSGRDFFWIVVCDPGTPDVWLDHIREHMPPNSELIMGYNFRKACVKFIEADLTDEDRIITSRIDNDDAIHKDYIKTIQKWFGHKNRTGVLTFPKGWVWDTRKDQVRHLRYVKNHFLTFIEKRGKKPVKTVLRARHTALTELLKTFTVETDFHAWLEVVHGENMANYSRGDKVRRDELVLEDYGI